jgi:sialic acid synthase SpsE
MRIIAELCQNHNGNRVILEQMIKAASESCDIVKIQTILADSLVKREEYEEFRPYQAEYDRLKSLELSEEDEKFFIDKCKEYGVEPMTTLFSKDQIDRFNRLGYKKLKISGYAMPAFDYGKALKDIEFDELFFSNSSLTHPEMKRSVINLKQMGINFTMLQCTCVYPTKMEKAMLQNIPFLKKELALDKIGYSDHSNPHEDGLLIPKLAIFSGIDVLERHFTILDKDETRDGKVSITPEMAKELKEFSLKVPFQQYWSLNEFNEQQCFNHDFYRGRFK